MKQILSLAVVLLALSPAYAPDRAQAQGVDSYLGSIWLFGGIFCPFGTAEAKGQLLAIDEHSALFAILGANYGGDGRTTFALPDLTNAVPIDAGDEYTTMRYCVNMEGVFPSRR